MLLISDILLVYYEIFFLKLLLLAGLINNDCRHCNKIIITGFLVDFGQGAALL